MPVPAERWTTIQNLFDEVADLPPAQQEAFLEARCSTDPAIRAEVLSLLRYDARDGTAVFSAVQAEAASMFATEPAVGRMLGPWRIERELGEGGMSVVYLGSRADGEFR